MASGEVCCGRAEQSGKKSRPERSGKQRKQAGKEKEKKKNLFSLFFLSLEKDPVDLLGPHRLPAARALGRLAQGLLEALVAERVAARAAGGLFDGVEADRALGVGERARLRACLLYTSDAADE